ncbi:MAG: hypothetical protein JRN68_02515 [Nitrososphaerota archaeon]|jgi:hypothetical protein|nr:hypothetical protein [Nitrososphaerota archaeon]
MKEKTAVYGASVEGYAVALSIMKSGNEVSILDERIKTSFTLMENAPTSIRQLVGEDSLYPIRPISSVLQSSSQVILAPRLRFSEEGRAEWLQRLKEVGQNLGEQAMLVNLVPLSAGGNKEALAIIEEQSGLKPGKDFRYVYVPVGSSHVAGYLGESQPPRWFDDIFGELRWTRTIEESELEYIRWALADYIPKALAISFYKEGSTLLLDKNKLFLDDMAQGLYDMHLFSDTLPHGDTLHHFATGALKAVSNYTHTLGSYLRNYARERGLKAIRSRILLVWGHEGSEMKGERARLQGVILNSLREVFGDVDSWNPAEQPEEKKRPPNLDRYQMIVPCSQADLKTCQAFTRSNSEQAIITASVPVSVL